MWTDFSYGRRNGLEGGLRMDHPTVTRRTRTGVRERNGDIRVVVRVLRHFLCKEYTEDFLFGYPEQNEEKDGLVVSEPV